MARALSRPGLLSLAAGFTDNAVLPADIVKEAVSAMPQAEPLQYGSNQGRTKLRETIAERLHNMDGRFHKPLDASGVVLTNGSQQALYLLAQTFCNEGDIVLVEAPTYCVIFDIFIGLGIKVQPLPMSRDGQVDVAATRELLGSMQRDGSIRRVRMAYFVSYFSNPAATSMDEDVKEMLGEVFADFLPRTVVVEDTAYRELYYERPHNARTCLATRSWKEMQVVVTGSFSKCFSPGLRLGYFATRNEEIVERVLRIKAQQDFGSGNLSQWIAEYALTKDLFRPYVESLRRHYHAKAKLLDAALRENGLVELGWHWEMPGGGLLFWLHGPDGLDTGVDGAFCKACLDENVLYVPGDVSYADAATAPKNNVRLSIGSLSPDDLREAARRYVKAARALG
jgi:2-aminoadipate transaminase